MALIEDSFESVTHSFIVRIWLEEDDGARWRGHVTHVSDGKRQYVEQFSDIVDFIAPYVDMKLGRTGWFRRWMAGRRNKPKRHGGHVG